MSIQTSGRLSGRLYAPKPVESVTCLWSVLQFVKLCLKWNDRCFWYIFHLKTTPKTIIFIVWPKRSLCKTKINVSHAVVAQTVDGRYSPQVSPGEIEPCRASVLANRSSIQPSYRRNVVAVWWEDTVKHLSWSHTSDLPCLLRSLFVILQKK